VLAKFLPNGVNNTNDMRSALSSGYRKEKEITETLRHNDVYPNYLKVQGFNFINTSITMGCIILFLHLEV